jgi:hypothetical protein
MWIVRKCCDFVIVDVQRNLAGTFSATVLFSSRVHIANIMQGTIAS